MQILVAERNKIKGKKRATKRRTNLYNEVGGNLEETKKCTEFIRKPQTKPKSLVRRNNAKKLIGYIRGASGIRNFKQRKRKGK